MVVSDRPRAPASQYRRAVGEGALAFLLRVCEELANSLDYDITLQKVAHLAVPFLADMCLVARTSPVDGRARAVAVSHVNAAMEARLREVLLDNDVESGGMVLRALRTRQPVIAQGVSEALLYSMAQQEGQRIHPAIVAVTREVAAKSMIAMPLLSRGRALGALLLGRCANSPAFEMDELPTIQQLARLCALAVDNAGLYREANDAVRVREELLAATSHELRAPLSEIKGFVTTLLREDTDWDHATRRDFLHEIDQQADRLDALIGDLLDMSRLMSGGCENFDRAPISPAVLVCRGLQRIRSRLAHTKLDIHAALGSLPSVCADSKRIEQVVANLVDNATKYAPGSTIRISGAAADGGARVELSIEDEGPGIREADLEHIFDKFYRGPSHKRSEVPGTGLGLAIARTIVEGHGGRIRAENRATGGARFVVSLPVAAACHE
jgi:signal transduction histidine kinase